MADGLKIGVAPFLEQLNAAIAKVDFQTKFIVGAALYEQMLDVMDEAKTLCPVESGALMESGRVNRATIKNGNISISLDFGVQPPLDYAVDQHENLLYAHKDGKQAKFLEVPLMNWVSSGGPSEVIEDVEMFLGKEIF